MTDSKRCPVCEETKPRSRFRGYAYCVECRPRREAEYYRANAERIKTRVKEYRAANPDKMKARNGQYYAANREECLKRQERYRRANPADPKAIRDYQLKRYYGISLLDYQQMLKTQDGACLICREVKALHVDHDHVSGAVRGLLCGHCNKALGGFRDNESILLSAIAYLRRAKLKLQKAV